MAKFKKKSEPVEAIEWTGKNLKAVEKIFPGALRLKNDRLYGSMGSGLLEVNQGDYLFADGTVVTAEALEADYEGVK